MALITDPDDLSQGLLTADIATAWTASSGANTILTAAAVMPTYAQDDFFEVRKHSQPENNGLYIATGAPTASNLPCTKVDGTNPSDQGSEDVDFLGDNGSAAEYKSVMIDTGQKRIYLLEQGNLSVDGVTGLASYSFLKEEWKSDAELIQNAFPLEAIGSVAEELEFLRGWEPRNNVTHSIQTKKLLRTVGWSEIDSTGAILSNQYSGIVTLGTFEDETNDNAYYSLGTDPTDTAAAVDFTFAGPVNEAILVYTDFGVPGDIVITLTTTITSAGSDFVAAGFTIGGSVTIQDSEDPANDGTHILTDVQTTVLVTTGLTNNADDTTMRLAVDNRNAVFPKVRVRDADPTGKTYDSSSVQDIGFTIIDNKAFRFPLSNVSDPFITETDANIWTIEPYTEIRLRYLPATYNREVDTTSKRSFGIVIDVGTHSKENGASATSTTFTATDFVLGTGEALADYTDGDLIIHEGTDQGTHTIVGTPTAPGGTLTMTLSGALTATESDLSFTMERDTPLTATAKQIYAKVQYQLRQDTDIDEGGPAEVVVGRTADVLINFIGLTDVRFGESAPTNPNGGGSGVIVEGFDTNDTNNMFFYDNSTDKYNFPYVAAGTIGWSDTLYPSDSAPEYWMFFQYTLRETVSDFAISGSSGSDASFDSALAELPTVVLNDYVALSDMTNPENNGIWIVTDAAPTALQFDARKVDSQTVVDESAASHPLDLDPVGSPQAIIVNNNAGSPLEGSIAAASTAFDFDYDGNVQGGRVAAEDAPIVIKAIGLEDAQYAETLGIITRATGLSFSVVSALERNYQNP